MDLSRLPEPVDHALDPRARLSRLLADRTQARDPQRGDELDQRFAHFSDLAFCRLATHARRSGVTRFVPNDDHALLFHIGHTFEDWCAETLGTLDDWIVRHGTDLVYALPDDDGIFFGTAPITYHEGGLRSDLLRQRAVVGHPDIILAHKTRPLGHLIECKTSTFTFVNGARRAPQAAKQSDLVQAAAYAVALNEARSITGRAFPFFSLWYGDKGGGMQAFLTYRTEDFTALIIHGLVDLIASTDPQAAPPPPEPPAYTVTVPSRGPSKGIPRSWLCQRCPHTACPRNDNGAAFEEIA